jgi:hypothetical protein
MPQRIIVCSACTSPTVLVAMSEIALRVGERDYFGYETAGIAINDIVVVAGDDIRLDQNRIFVVIAAHILLVKSADIDDLGRILRRVVACRRILLD